MLPSPGACMMVESGWRRKREIEKNRHAREREKRKHTYNCYKYINEGVVFPSLLLDVLSFGCVMMISEVLARFENFC